MDWTGPDTTGRYVMTFEGRTFTAYPTPGRSRGWTLEVDGVPDDGLTACSPRVGRGFASAQPLLEIVARAHVFGPARDRTTP